VLLSTGRQKAAEGHSTKLPTTLDHYDAGRVRVQADGQNTMHTYYPNFLLSPCHGFSAGVATRIASPARTRLARWKTHSCSVETNISGPILAWPVGLCEAGDQPVSILVGPVLAPGQSRSSYTMQYTWETRSCYHSNCQRLAFCRFIHQRNEPKANTRSGPDSGMVEDDVVVMADTTTCQPRIVAPAYLLFDYLITNVTSCHGYCDIG
jgi:hypothetical protein